VDYAYEVKGNVTFVTTDQQLISPRNTKSKDIERSYKKEALFWSSINVDTGTHVEFVLLEILRIVLQEQLLQWQWNFYVDLVG